LFISHLLIKKREILNSTTDKTHKNCTTCKKRFTYNKYGAVLINLMLHPMFMIHLWGCRACVFWQQSLFLRKCIS